MAVAGIDFGGVIPNVQSIALGRDNLNDGTYGNSNSWIGGDADSGPGFAGINLNGLFEVNRVAFGRDNGNTDTDACGGTCTDRWQGEYTFQYTQVANADETTPVTNDPTTGWATTFSLNYDQPLVDDGPGGDFTAFLRHEFSVSQGGQAVLASAIRVLVPATGLGGGTAIDELEVYAVPEPSSFAFLGLIAVSGWVGQTTDPSGASSGVLGFPLAADSVVQRRRVG